MATKHIREGKTLSYPNASGSTITKGTVVELAACIGIALGDIANGATGEIAVDEVWELTKVTGVEITVGDQVYWDAANNRVDKTNTNIPCGIAAATAASAATAVQVLLNK